MKLVRVAPTAEHVVDTAQVLWPAPSVAELVRAGEPVDESADVREFLFVPSAARPRLLLPAVSAASAASALRRYSDALGTVERVGRVVGAAALRLGLGHLLLRDRLRVTSPAGPSGGASIETELSELLGEQVVVSLGLGNRRANQKPVLQVLSPDGRSLAFVKVGDNEVTSGLVRAEATALEHLAGVELPGLRIPRVLHLGSWRGLDLLVLSPLHTSARRRPGADELQFAAFAELATALGVEDEPVEGSPYWSTLASQVDQVAGDEADRLRRALAEVSARHGDTVLTFGSWHGDWTPWNQSWERSGVTVWDWERFTTGVPVGFDALHFHLWTHMARTTEKDEVVRQLAERAPRLLHQTGVTTAGTSATVALYLMELCVRFTLAAQGPTGQPLRKRAQWLLDAVTRHLDAR
jgi:hypothetical protein